ncbi:hypothetical protein B0H11DRAFT_2251251 [Mycena galericulata]|nr:hypothetical protein B0H11DRAFT_2251251 [Mycena galericulata]
MIAAIHLVAHILFVLALVASAAALLHANDTTYFCGSRRSSHEHGVTPSHPRLPAVGVLSLTVVLLKADLWNREELIIDLDHAEMDWKITYYVNHVEISD